MITIISPAKTFNETSQQYAMQPTIPGFLDDSQKLVNTLRKQSLPQLENLMSINPRLALLNKQRYKSWQLPFSTENAKPAAYLFRGEVYIGLDTATLAPADMEFAQDHLRILSGMYGLLRPMDLMQPYRLEMGTRLKISRKKNLYEFWGERLGQALTTEAAAHDNKLLVNLASDQYFLAVQPKTLKLPVITPVFKEDRDGKLKSIHVYAKRARGLMARYIIQHRLENPEDLKSFNVDGYHFSSQHSDSNEWVFVRPQTGPGTSR